MPKLKRNILNFGYRIDFKYEGMPSPSFDIIYVDTKFVLPIIEDLKFSPIEFDSYCSYLDVDINRSKFPTQYIPNISNVCKKIVPFIYFYKKQIDYYNQRAHEILTKEIFDTDNVSKRKKRKEEHHFFLVEALLVWHMKVYLAICIIEDKKHYIKHLWPS